MLRPSPMGCSEGDTLTRIWAFSIAIVLLMCSSLAAAQSSSQGAADAQDDQEITLKVTSFGVGGTARLGDWAGIQINLFDNGSSPRDIILRLPLRDADGDETQYDRVVTASPGQTLSYWLYGWIPFRDASGDGYEVRAYEAIETAISESNPLGYRAGRLLGRTQIMSRAANPSIGFVGVVGSNQAGLNQYGTVVNQRSWSPFGHELLVPAAGLRIDTLPDRWQGLMALDAIVWTESTVARSDPNRLTPEKARALRTWIAGGGHLVILLPPSGDPWYSTQHPLRSLLPVINRPERREGVDLDEYRALITESADIELPSNTAVQIFTAADSALPGEAMPVLNGPDGGCVVIRRLFGSGMITIVGLDLTHGQLRRVGLPDVESFWHRVLGQRGPSKRIDQMSEQEKGDAGNRPIRLFDTGVEGAIAKTGRAVQGVLFGLLVFLLYWVVAGPGGFFALKSRSKQHHAWVAFVAATGIFTAIAWMGATALRPKTKNISHLTLLEQVHGQELARGRSWMSAMLPSYGSSVVSLRDEQSVLENPIADQLITPWASPATSGGLTEGYPDNTGYRVEARDPGELRVPTRATVKDFRADWVGTTDWSMPRPVSAVGDLNDPALTSDGRLVSGMIRHELPAALTDVLVILVHGQNRVLSPGQELARRSVSRVSVFSPSFPEDRWEPGADMNLATVTEPIGTNRQVIRNSFFANAVRKGEDATGIDTVRAAPLIERLIVARMLSQFDPPNYGVQNDLVGSRVAQRRMLHGWDLGRWFTQPCVIVLGAMQIPQEDASVDGIPSKVYIDGRAVEAAGTTIVAWIYPLEAEPPTMYIAGQAIDEMNEDGAP